jgi:kumamolisin
MRKQFALAVFTFLLCGLISAVAQGVGNSRQALPYPNASTPKAMDLGPLTAHAGSTPISVTVVLSLRDPGQAENLFESIYTAGSPQYHQFLSANEFAQRFGPTESAVTKVATGMAKYGLLAERTSATTLRVTGLPNDMERAFAVRLHSYQVASHGNARSYTFHAPLSHATVPTELAGSVAAVLGLDSRPSLRPLHRPAVTTKIRPAAKFSATGNAPGFLTVTDFADRYDVQPLYQHGASGKGRTIGIVTLASFTPSDAFAYWSALGLTVNPGRITVSDIDGGPGAPSDESGSLETTLDVEQSGGIAPGANVIVYQAPNTNQGFVDAMAAAVDSNSADTVSTSWGFWEWYQNLENSPVTDQNGNTVGITTAFHELFLRAAIQGQSLFAASGDGGAYDINNDFGCSPESTPSCSLTLSVDDPASDPAITAAGGTTLPGLQEYCLNQACTPPFFDVNIANEQVWGWDYLTGLCAALGAPDPIACGIFPGGSGGGVSIIFPTPFYQMGISGVQRSQPRQNWMINGQLVYALPAHYAGRNVPDVSANADPQTGYVVYYTSSKTGFAPEPFWGGTSFVAPQLNGVTSLLNEVFRGRVGLLNFPLYALARTRQGYNGSHPPLRAIRDGDNWFYHGRNGYSPAVGVGTLDVANLVRVLRDE